MLRNHLCLTLVVAMPLSAYAGGPLPDIGGAWTTPLALQEAAGASAYVRERLVFGDDTNTISIEVFTDAEGKMPLFTYSSSGPYKVGNASSIVSEAFLLDAQNETSSVTIYQDAPQIWQTLNLGACDLKVGTAVEISDCVAGPPFNAARCTELDLVSIQGNELRLGSRNTDRCKDRPSSLGETVYTRAISP